MVEPHERRSVYIGASIISGGGEGIFARRSFSPGQLVSYFNGVRVTEEMMFRDNMTKVGEGMMKMMKCHEFYRRRSMRREGITLVWVSRPPSLGESIRSSIWTSPRGSGAT